jgi:hypothetical protein
VPRLLIDLPLICGFTAGLIACVELPDPPDLVDLSDLSESFEEPTGRLPSESTAEVLEAANDYLGVVYSLDGLSLLTTAMVDTSEALDEALPESVKAQGKIDAELACPGEAGELSSALQESNDADDEDEDDEDNTDGEGEPGNGTLAVTMGIKNSRIQRGVSGSARDCRFLSMRGNREVVTFSATIAADFGADVSIGERPDAFLMVRLTDLEVSNESRSLPTPLDAYVFRVVQEEGIELLVDTEDLGLGDFGTIVLISYTDGSIGIRETRGEWQCTQDGSCELDRR